MSGSEEIKKVLMKIIAEDSRSPLQQLEDSLNYKPEPLMPLNRMKIYLCSPIDGVTPEWATEWRRKVRDTLTGWTVLDPTEGKDLYAPGVNDTVYTPEEIVEADLAMVEQADVVLVDWRDVKWVVHNNKICSGVLSASTLPLRVGTICEVWEAHRLGKRVVAFGALRRGYWIRYCVDEWFDTLDEALNKIQEG